MGVRRSSSTTWLVMFAVFAVAAYFVWKDPEGAWLRLRAIWNSLPDLFPKF
ncbi:MAG: hypothetical protein ACRD2Q_05795 [Terriglobales bacterium]